MIVVVNAGIETNLGKYTNAHARTSWRIFHLRQSAVGITDDVICADGAVDHVTSRLARYDTTERT